MIWIGLKYLPCGRICNETSEQGKDTGPLYKQENCDGIRYQTYMYKGRLRQHTINQTKAARFTTDNLQHFSRFSLMTC